MRFCHLMLILLMLSGLAGQAWAQDYDPIWDDTDPRDWTFSAAPGYGFLYVNGEDAIRHGGSARLMSGYRVAPGWHLLLKGRLSLYDGDGNDLQGIYSQFSLLGAFRYTFLDDWVQPYVGLSVGWVRTELDREIDTLYSTHSMIVEPDAGVVFRILDFFYLGLETSIAPQFFGNHDINGSFHFQSVVTAELRI